MTAFAPPPWFTTGQAPPTRSSSAPPRWWCAARSAASSGHTTSLEPRCGTNTTVCPAAAPRSSSTPAAAPLIGCGAAALTCVQMHPNMGLFYVEGFLCENKDLPELPRAACSLADEDDDGEDLESVQPPHTVQTQRQHAVSSLLVNKKREIIQLFRRKLYIVWRLNRSNHF